MSIFKPNNLNVLLCLTLFGFIAIGVATAGSLSSKPTATPSSNLPALQINISSIVAWLRSLLGFSSQTGYPPPSGLSYSTSTIPITYTFTEIGLPAGSNFTVTVAGQTQTTAVSISQSLTFTISSTGSSAYVLYNVLYNGIEYIVANQTFVGSRFTITYKSSIPTTTTVPSTTSTTTTIPSNAVYYLTRNFTCTPNGGPSGGGYPPVAYPVYAIVTINALPSPCTGQPFLNWTGTGRGSYAGPNAVAQVTMYINITETARYGSSPTTSATTTITNSTTTTTTITTYPTSSVPSTSINLGTAPTAPTTTTIGAGGGNGVGGGGVLPTPPQTSNSIFSTLINIIKSAISALSKI